MGSVLSKFQHFVWPSTWTPPVAAKQHHFTQQGDIRYEDITENEGVVAGNMTNSKVIGAVIMKYGSSGAQQDRSDNQSYQFEFHW